MIGHVAAGQFRLQRRVDQPGQGEAHTAGMLKRASMGSLRQGDTELHGHTISLTIGQIGVHLWVRSARAGCWQRAALTDLLNLGSWHSKIPGLSIIVRDEPLHPHYRKRATEREKQLGRRYQLIALNPKAGQVARLDARHRDHVHVENDVKQAESLGLYRWPSRHWAINVAWTQDRHPGREPPRLLPPSSP